MLVAPYPNAANSGVYRTPNAAITYQARMIFSAICDRQKNQRELTIPPRMESFWSHPGGDHDLGLQNPSHEKGQVVAVRESSRGSERESE